MNPFLQRRVAGIRKDQQTKFPVLTVTEPRQSGKTTLLKQLDKFEEAVIPEQVNKTLIYGGLENQQRTKYNVVSWKDINN